VNGTDRRQLKPAIAERQWVVVLVVAAAYYALARLGLLLALRGTASSPVWPASGFAITAAALAGPAACWGVLLGSWLANIQAVFGGSLGTPLATAAAVAAVIAVGSAAQAWVGAAAFKRFLSARCPIDHSQDVVRFAGLTPLVCLISASAGTAAYVVADLTPRELFGASWLTWWVGDVSGVLLVYTLLMAWLPGEVDEAFEPVLATRWPEAVASAILLAVSVHIGFGDAFMREPQYPLSFLPLPALVWVALRLGTRGAATGALLLAALVHARTIVGDGPFSIGWSTNESLMLSSGYVATAALTAFLLHALLLERRRAEAALLETQRTLLRDFATKTENLRMAKETIHVVAQGRKDDQNRIRQYRRLVEKLPVGVAILSLGDPADIKTWRIREINPAGRRLSESDDSEMDESLLEYAPELFETTFPSACREALQTGEERRVPDFVSRAHVPGTHFSLSVLPLGAPFVAMVFEIKTALGT